MYQRFKNYIIANELLQKKQKILVACSGGADSMCLLTLMQMLATEWDLEIVVCHVNHNLREQEAERDAEFVRAHCQKYDLKFELFSLPVREFAKCQRLSIEQAARQLRYKALRATKEKLGCQAIATAHNKNDQAETFLLNMLRGAGINGLKGMLPQKNELIRPLLTVERAAIEAFCLEHQLAYVTDSSNESREYLRNRIRHELLPILQEYNPNITNSLTANMQNIAQDATYLNELAKQAAASILSWDFDVHAPGYTVVSLAADQLQKLHVTIALRVLMLAIERSCGSTQGINQTHLQQLYQLSHSNTGSKQLKLPSDLIARKLYDKISISKYPTTAKNKQPLALTIKTPGVYNFGASKLLVERVSRQQLPRSSKDKLFIPYSLAPRTLLVRTRQAGDFFELEHGGRKSVKSFFIDQKIEKNSRDHVPLVYLDNKLICILGHRLLQIPISTNCTDYWQLEYQQ